jgi:hypothetical protein
MTRQGVRWRFQHLFNQAYVDAFATILMIEKNFGTHLRDYAVRISKERHALYQETLRGVLHTADSLSPSSSTRKARRSGDRE